MIKKMENQKKGLPVQRRRLPRQPASEGRRSGQGSPMQDSNIATLAGKGVVGQKRLSDLAKVGQAAREGADQGHAGADPRHAAPAPGSHRELHQEDFPGPAEPAETLAPLPAGERGGGEGVGPDPSPADCASASNPSPPTPLPNGERGELSAPLPSDERGGSAATARYFVLPSPPRCPCLSSAPSLPCPCVLPWAWVQKRSSCEPRRQNHPGGTGQGLGKGS